MQHIVFNSNTNASPFFLIKFISKKFDFLKPLINIDFFSNFITNDGDAGYRRIS